MVLALSCKKTNDDPQQISSVAFIHASPGTPYVQIFMDTLLQEIPTNAADTLGYSRTLTGTASFTSGYVGVLAGDHQVSLENRATTPKKVFGSFTRNFEASKAYSVFLYDTVNSSGQAGVLQLNDDLSLPVSGSTKIRFLHLAPNAPTLDVTLIRGTAFDTSTATGQQLKFIGTDSVTITNRSFIGSHPDINALSAFTHTINGSSGEAIFTSATIAGVPGLNQNNRYVIRLKAAGTQNVLAESVPTPLNRDNIYTIFARGTAMGQPLGVSVFANYVRF